MPPIETLTITVDPGGLSMRRSGRSASRIALPDLPETEEFLDDVDCMKFSSNALTLEGNKRQEELKDHLKKSGGPEPVALRIGQRLFDMVFPTPAFVEAYRSVRDDADSMRLVLEFVLDASDTESEVNEWAALPWEYLYDTQDDGFVALRPTCRLVRRLSSGRTIRRFAAQAPLKVLALIAEPWDQHAYGREEALRSLTADLTEGQVQVIQQPQPTLPSLVRSLAEHQPHVLHVVAHGLYDDEHGGILAIEDEYGATHVVPAQQFAQQVADNNIRLVVLNSCLSAAGEGAVAYTGVAQALLRAGVPAVVAMQYSVPVVTAHRFTGALYRAISNGTPLDEAVATARRTLSVDTNLAAMDWAMPVLYMQEQEDEWSLGPGEGEATDPVLAEAAVPNNLGAASHPRPQTLVGRDAAMVAIARRLRLPLQQTRFVTVTGMGGIGKTAAALESAFWHRDRNYFPDGVFWFSARDTSYAELLNAIGTGIGVPDFGKQSQQEQENIVRETLERRSMLLVLDNVDGLRDQAPFRQFLASISSSPAGRILLTSRRRMDVEAEAEVPLLSLALKAAVRLFTTAWEPGWTTVEQRGEGLREVEAICGPGLLAGHPLAVVIAASVARREQLPRLESLSQRLRESMADTLKDNRTPGEEVSIVATLGVTYDILGDTAQQMLPRLAVFENPFREEAAEAMASELAGWRDALYELLDHHLLERIETKTTSGETLDEFSMHPVVRSYGQDRADDIIALRLRAGRFLVGTSYPSEVIEGIRHLEAGEAWEEVMEAVERIQAYLDRSGRWVLEEEVLQAGLRGARITEDTAKEGAHLGVLGVTHDKRGDFKGAINYYGRALELARESSDKPLEMKQLADLGSSHIQLGEVETAIDYFHQALQIAKEIDHKQGEGVNLGSLGSAYRHLGDFEKSIDYHEQALEILRNTGDREGEGVGLGNLGIVYRNSGEIDKAIEYLRQALEIAREIDNRRIEGITLENLGRSHQEKGEHETSLEYLLQGFVILQSIGSPGVSAAGGAIARLRDEVGEEEFDSLLARVNEKLGTNVNYGSEEESPEEESSET